MHDNDVKEQTRELSYPRELKIILHFSESRRDAECTKRICATSGFSCQTVCLPTVSVCQVKQFSFE